jgi:hypothetical protein
MDEWDALRAVTPALIEPADRVAVVEAAQVWRQVERDGFDLMSPKWWDATRRLRDAIDRLAGVAFDVENAPTGEHGADTLTGGV